MSGHPWRAVYIWIFAVGALFLWNYEAYQPNAEWYLRNYGTKAALSVLILGGVTLYAIESLRRSGFGDALRRLLSWAWRRWKPLVSVTLLLTCALVVLLVRADSRRTRHFSTNDVDEFDELLRQAPQARSQPKPTTLVPK